MLPSLALVKRFAFGLVAFVVATCAQAAAQPFGVPPSGAFPILFNDQHVYAKPDTLQQGRALAALVRKGTVLVPLRSMFEQMGAAVSYDFATRTVTVYKTGANVQVTVGQPRVVINGEARPLGVPPILWRGSVLVPVRVISEGMGAYVQWVPDLHAVVARYVPLPIATPPPAPPPPPPPPQPAPAPPPSAPPVTPPPPPTPAPTKPPQSMVFVSGDYVFQPRVYNEFSPGNIGSASEAARGGFAFPLGGLPIMGEPSVSGNVQPPAGPALNLSYRVLRYQGGLALSIPKTPVFVEGGVVGDSAQNGKNAPIPFTHQGLYAGVGIHF